jgi:hypothetical protein
MLGFEIHRSFPIIPLAEVREIYQGKDRLYIFKIKDIQVHN